MSTSLYVHDCGVECVWKLNVRSCDYPGLPDVSNFRISTVLSRKKESIHLRKNKKLIHTPSSAAHFHLKSHLISFLLTGAKQTNTSGGKSFECIIYFSLTFEQTHITKPGTSSLSHTDKQVHSRSKDAQSSVSWSADDLKNLPGHHLSFQKQEYLHAKI